MQVKVRCLRREGRNLHSQGPLAQPPSVGELTVAEGRDIELGRVVVRARLLQVRGSIESDMLPELSDARLLWVGDKELRLDGFERVNNAAYAQTWAVEVV